MTEQLSILIEHDAPLPVVGKVGSSTPLGLDGAGADTRAGTAVSYDLLEQLREQLHRLRPEARRKIAAVALSFATGMHERPSLFAVERICTLRSQHGETEPDIARRLNPPEEAPEPEIDPCDTIAGPSEIDIGAAYCPKCRTDVLPIEHSTKYRGTIQRCGFCSHELKIGAT